MAVIDLLAMLPAISMLNEGLKIFKIIRLFRIFRVLRIFKAVRYSRNIQIILNVEPQTFENYFDAMISSVRGIAVVALPAGIITSGLLEELNSGNRE